MSPGCLTAISFTGIWEEGGVHCHPAPLGLHQGELLEDDDGEELEHCDHNWISGGQGH